MKKLKVRKDGKSKSRKSSEKDRGQFSIDVVTTVDTSAKSFNNTSYEPSGKKPTSFENSEYLKKDKKRGKK